MKSNWLFISLIAIACCTCCSGGTSPSDQEQKNHDSLKRDIRKKPPSSFQDSLIIDSVSVVFFEPDSLQMEKIKLINEKMIFESLTHDCFYQMKNAKQVLEKNQPGLAVRLVSKDRWLVFRKTHGERIIIDLNQINDICGIYLFDPTKNPLRIVMTKIDSELGFYFKKN